MIKAISYGAPSYRKDEWDKNNILKLKYYKQDLDMIKELGATHIRVYDVLPLEFYQESVSHGFQVLQQLPGIYAETNFSSLAELTEIQRRHREVIQKLQKYHVSAWIPWNDLPYTWTNTGNIVNRWGYDVCNNFLKEIVANIKKVSEVRVMSANLSNSEARNMTGDDLGFKYVDIIGCNAYFGIKDWVKGEFSEELLLEQTMRLKTTQDKYNKPVLISETGFASHWGEIKQSVYLETQVKAALKEFGAVCIFEFADEAWKKPIFSHEDSWGLVTENRQHKKVAFETIRKVFNGA